MPHTAREGRSGRPGLPKLPPPPPIPGIHGVEAALPSIFMQRQNLPDRQTLSVARQKYALRLAEEKIPDLCLSEHLDEENLRAAAYVLQKFSEICSREADCLVAQRKSGTLARMFQKIKTGFTGGNDHASC